MLFVVIGLVMGVIVGLLYYCFGWWTDEGNRRGGAISLGILDCFFMITLSGCIGLFTVSDNLQYSEVVNNYKLSKESGYYLLYDNGDFVTTYIEDEQGKVVSKKFYFDEDEVKFVKDDEASVTVVTNEVVWSKSDEVWIGLWGILYEPEDDVVSVTITIPNEKHCYSCKKEFSINDNYCSSCGIPLK